MSPTTSNDWLTPNEERLLNTFVDKGIRELRPKRTEHTVVYSGIEEITGELGPSETKRLLRSLISKGFLVEKSYDSAISCPNCESISVRSIYTCPRCESMNVHKVQLQIAQFAAAVAKA